MYLERITLPSMSLEEELLYSTVYNLDAEIIDICDWTELESIQVYRDFFRRLEHNLSRREDRA